MSFQDDGGFGDDENSFDGGGEGKCSDDQTDISSEQFRKLFVGGLSYETDEKSLRSHFEQWGEIVDCVVVRDPDTKRSRGFGFITYKESFMIDEAQKNRPHTIDNREVTTERAMPRNADGASNHQSVKKMFVGGLKDDTTEEQMREVFGKFVKFQDEGRDGGRGGGKYGDDQTDISSEQFRKLFVGGLSYETDEKSLRSHFEQWGEVVNCVVVHDPDTKRSRRFGFITYKESFMIDEAQKNRPHKIDNTVVETQRAMPRNADGSSNRQSVNRMFVSGLKDDTTEEQMRDVFGKFGEIDSVKICTDKATGKCRGFAFITYKDYDSVDRAVLLKRHDLNTRRVEVKKAVPKDQMDDSSPSCAVPISIGSRESHISHGSGSGRGGGSVGWGQGRGGYGFGGGSCGYSSMGAFGGAYGGGSNGGSGGGYGGGFAGGQNWGVSSWGGGGGASGFGSNYVGNCGGGPMKGCGGGPEKGGSGGPEKGGSGGPVESSLDVQPVAKDLMEVAMVVVDSDDKVTTEEAGEFVAQYKQTVIPIPNEPLKITGLPLEEEIHKTELSVTNPNSEHINIQKVNPRKRKRRQEKAIVKSADNVVEGEEED